MLDSKVSIPHWEKSDIFLPFDALGMWALIIEADTSKCAWGNPLRWMDEQHRNIQEQSISQVTALLHTIPWKDYIRGLGLCLSLTDMATFLSWEWLLDTHIDSMLSAAVHSHKDSLSCMVPHTEIVWTDFASHILISPLLEMTPIAQDYADKAPKSVLCIGSIISSCPIGIQVAAISFSPPGHCRAAHRCTCRYTWT